MAGIVHLVAASVPEMTTKAVSAGEDAGNLLSNPPDGQQMGVDTQQLQYVNKLEESYTRRVMDILEPILGRNNVRAQVTADVDFSLSEQTSESHGPNQGGAPRAGRSAATMLVGGGQAGAPPDAPSDAAQASEGDAQDGDEDSDDEPDAELVSDEDVGPVDDRALIHDWAAARGEGDAASPLQPLPVKRFG